MGRTKYPGLADFIRVNYATMTDMEMARAMGCKEETIYYWRFKKLGLCKEKVNWELLSQQLPADTLLKEYQTAMLTERQLARKYGLPRHQVRELLRRAGISPIGKTERNEIRLATGFKDNQAFRSMVFGSLLGDAGVYRRGKHCYFKVSHSKKQYLYLKHKFDILQNSGLIVSILPGSKVVNGHTFYSDCIWTASNSLWSQYRELFYVDGVKTWNPKFYELLTPEAFAYWIGDDGSSSVDGNLSFVSELLTQVEDIEVFVAFMRTWGLDFTWSPCTPKLTIFRLAVDSEPKFYELIAPHLPIGVRYKAPRLSSVVAELKLISKDDFDSFTEKKLLAIYRGRGFPYPLLSDADITEKFSQIQHIPRSTLQVDDNPKLLRFSRIGIDVANFFHPNIWEARRKGLSPYDAFMDDEQLCRVFRRRVRYGRDFLPDQINYGLRLLTHSPTNFPPLLAKVVYESFLPSEGKVLDFSGGFGGRVLGYLASMRGTHYTGVDPNARTIAYTEKMLEYFSSSDRVSLYRLPAEQLDLLSLEDYDLCFTSPPYFDYEVYDATDLWQVSNSCSTLAQYRQWISTVGFRVHSALKPTGVMVLHLTDTLLGRKRRDKEQVSVRTLWRQQLELQGWVCDDDAGIQIKQPLHPAVKNRTGKMYGLEYLDVFRKK